MDHTEALAARAKEPGHAELQTAVAAALKCREQDGPISTEQWAEELGADLAKFRD